MNRAGQIMIVIGFALCNRASSHSFLTAFGMFAPSSGYLASPLFTVAANVAIVASSLVIALTARKKPLPFFGIPYAVLAAVACAMSFGVQAGMLDLLGDPLNFVILGIVFGFALVPMSFCWFEMMTLLSPQKGTVLFLIACLLSSCAAPMVAGFFASYANALDIVCLIASVAIMSYLRQRARKNGRMPARVEGLSAPLLKDMAVPVATAAIFEGTVALVNVALVGTASANAAASVPVWLGNVAAAVLLIVLILATREHPHPTQAFRIIFPVLLAVLLMFLLLGDAFGTVAGLTLAIGNYFVSFSLVFFLLHVSASRTVSVVVLMAAANAVTKTTLLSGFFLSDLFTKVSYSTSITLTTITVVFAVYLLSMAAALIGGWRRSTPRSDEPVVLADAGVPTSPALIAKRTVASMGDEYHLTKREKEMLGYLVRGWGSKQIASQLFLSENTVWGHIRHLYQKTEVSSKQELINLYEDHVARKEDGPLSL